MSKVTDCSNIPVINNTIMLLLADKKKQNKKKQQNLGKWVGPDGNANQVSAGND